MANRIIRNKGITKLPNSEQSYKGKVKTHNYITDKISQQPETGKMTNNALQNTTQKTKD